MKKITRSALLPYSAAQVFALVNDVAAYRDFLPWCDGSEVIEQSDNKMIAGVTIAKMGVNQTFITENTLIENESIVMQLKEGPFTHLTGQWTFKSLDETACKIEFDVAFEVSNGLLNAAIGTVFEQIATTLVQSFCDRAKAVYGKTV